MSNVNVGAALGASFRYLPPAWRQAAGILAASVFASLVFAIARAATPHAPLLSLVQLIVQLAVGTAATGALYRITLAGDHGGDPSYALGPAGYQWGPLEWRVLGANLLLAVLFIVPLVVILIVWAICVGSTLVGHADALQGLQSGSNSNRLAAFAGLMTGPPDALTVIIFVPTLIAVVYVGARLALFTLRAADIGAFDLPRAWSMTRGAALTLIVAGIVIYLTSIAVAFVFGAVGGLMADLAGQHDAAATWGSISGGAASVAIAGPLFAGLQLYVYHAQRGDGGVAETFA
jgi:hypothetical protein